MNEASENGKKTTISWVGASNEVSVEMGPEFIRPRQPITGERLESLKAERALQARLYPKYRAHLESLGIFLTPEELQEPPPSGNAKSDPSF